MDTIIGTVPKVFEFGKRFVEVDMRRTELRRVVQEVESKVEDMEQEAKNEERQAGKKRKKVFEAYTSETQRYRESAQSVLDGSQEGQWMVKRMLWVPSIERHYKEGQDHLINGSQLVEEGLTYDEIRTRGELLPLEEDQYMGETVTEIMDSALKAIQDGKSQCIGIYGNTGSGKTNLMKHLYNKIFLDKNGFKAVFWATAPEFLDSDHANYYKAVQKSVAGGMWVDLENDLVHDEVRCAGQLMARLQEIGTGRAVLFLDNVRAEFPAYELLGIPSLMESSTRIATATETTTTTASSESEHVNCILVFTTMSKDVCNKMRCDRIFKVDLLDQKEAQDLFLYEVGLGDKDRRLLSFREQNIYETAVEVANQCARMPLAIIIIARSMARIDDLCEWRHRLNELMGTIASIHDEEDKILEQLKFGYICLKDTTIQRCFLAAANLLDNDKKMSKQDIIAKWKNRGFIGRDRRPEFADDQGHAILNQLERMCLVQVEVVPERDHQKVITMNKWIRKMATKVSMP